MERRIPRKVKTGEPVHPCSMIRVFLFTGASLGFIAPIERSVKGQISLSGYAEISLRGSSAC